MFYLGDCIESPIYKGGELQSRCNGTPSSGGYEIVGSVTAESLLRECATDVGVRLNRSCLLRAPPSRERKVPQVILRNIAVGL